MVRKVTRDTSPMAGRLHRSAQTGDDLGQHDPGGVRTVNASMHAAAERERAGFARGAQLVELADRVG
jgi:hypothetical protein